MEGLESYAEALVAQITLAEAHALHYLGVGKKCSKFVIGARYEDITIQDQVGHTENTVRIEGHKQAHLLDSVVGDIQRQLFALIQNELVRDGCEASTTQLVVSQVQVLEVLTTALLAFSGENT